MSHCKGCGKKGFFLHINKTGLCDSCMKEALEKAKGQERRWEETKCKMDENLRIANEQVAQLNAARNKYEKTKEYGKLIEVYENILSPLPTTWNSLSHTFLLVEYYQKDNQRDKAWTLLNSILLKYPNEACRVRRAQYRLLKREKNFSEALKMYFLYKFNDCKSIVCWETVRDSERNSFFKEAQALAKSAKLDIQAVPQLADSLIKLVENPYTDERTAIREFNSWYSKLV